MRRDALSAVFLALLGGASAGISMFSAGYFRKGEGALPGLLCLEYHCSSPAWASCCSPTTPTRSWWRGRPWRCRRTSWSRRSTAFRRSARAGFLYLLIAHVGAIGILLSFGIMQGGSWQFTFDAMRAAHLSPGWATAAFGLALFGFGAKAGLVPLHVWLPEAHPAAPSPVSALMSGVMLKTAVYGMLRVSFDLLGTPQWWWGLVRARRSGSSSALLRRDLRGRADRHEAPARLVVDRERRRDLHRPRPRRSSSAAPACALLAALALIATLYHCLNHAFMKSLLFLGTGSVLHATGERNLGRLGGLIHRMPWVAWLTLVGVLAIAGLPPLNGFVSEWLLLQAFLFAGEVPHTFVNMLLPRRRCGRRAVHRACRLRDGEVLRHHLSRPAARGRGSPRRTMLVSPSASGWCGLRAGCVAARPLPGAGHRHASTMSRASC